MWAIPAREVSLARWSASLPDGGGDGGLRGGCVPAVAQVARRGGTRIALVRP